MFVNKIDEDTAVEIVEKVYNNEDEKFCMWSPKIDEKEQELEVRKRQIKRRAARGYRPAAASRNTNN